MAAAVASPGRSFVDVIQARLVDERECVTAKWLSYHLGVRSLMAADMLAAFVKAKEEAIKDMHANFVVTGLLASNGAKSVRLVSANNLQGKDRMRLRCHQYSTISTCIVAV
jgi:hypothetical protein